MRGMARAAREPGEPDKNFCRLRSAELLGSQLGTTREGSIPQLERAPALRLGSWGVGELPQDEQRPAGVRACVSASRIITSSSTPSEKAELRPNACSITAGRRLARGYACAGERRGRRRLSESEGDRHADPDANGRRNAPVEELITPLVRQYPQRPRQHPRRRQPESDDEQR